MGLKPDVLVPWSQPGTSSFRPLPFMFHYSSGVIETTHARDIRVVDVYDTSFDNLVLQ
jgi:hypothetical protein